MAPPPHFYNTHPIIAFLHAGTYMAGAGASDIFQPDHFLEHSLMVVTINHRLGPLGEYYHGILFTFNITLFNLMEPNIDSETYCMCFII